MKTNMSRMSCAVLVFVLFIVSAFQMYSVFADASDDVVTATINYYYYDENKQDYKGTSPFPSFVANMPKGSADITQKSPIVPGFSPCDILKHPLSTVTISFNEDSNTDVFYFPAEVDYLIRLYKQDLNNDEYTVAEVINSQGVTGSEPVEFGANFLIHQIGDKTLENAFEGFTLMYHVPEVIAADGSTEFECYYDRNYYLVSLDLGDGAYGVEPLYVPYEYPISLGTPVRTGYVFDGWEIEKADTHEAMSGLPSTMPAYNIHCTAKWRAVNNVNYTVVFCNADVDDGSVVTKYSHWGDKKLSALPDTEFTLDDIIAANKDDITSLTDYEYFTFDPEATAAKNNSTITVKSDGSTIVRLYYKRNKYKLRFVYLKHTGSTSYIAGNPVTSVTDNHQYVLVNTNRGRSKALTNEKNSDTDSMRKLVDFNNNNFTYLWTFVPADGGYYIQYSDGKYLSVDFQTPDAGNNAIVSDDPMLFKIAPYGDSTNEWLIYTIYSNKNFYLNDKSNKGERVQVYPTTGNGQETANRWQLYDFADATVSTNTVNIKAASRTGSGAFPVPDSYMTYTLTDFPEVDISAGLVKGSFNYNNATYDYIELVAEYNADIEDIWPADVISPVGEYHFGSWSTQAGTKYRERHSTHANIVGAYPYLSSEMIVDPTKVYDPSNPDQIAQMLWAWWGKSEDNVGEHRLKIYYESLDGTGYELDRTIELFVAHNSNTRIDPFVYKGYTIIPSEANGHSQSWGEGNGHHLEYDDEHPDGIWTTDFHYTRNTYSLSYRNYNADYTTGADTSSIKYGSPLSGFEPTEDPPYPSGLKPDSYEFAGWYDSDTYDNLFDWTGTMPDSNVVVYAYWKPRTFDIYYYNDESDYQNGNVMIHQGTGDYGNKLDTSEAEGKLTPPEIINSTGRYEAMKAGWYYYDEDGELHAFDPETMTVSEGMNLFMKWSSTVPANFTMHYYVKGTENNASPTEVAPDTTGYSFVGLTRTFKAKVENELNDGYRECYFPDRSSTSILMKADSSENVKAFLYTYRENVPYTVRYIAKDGPDAGEMIHESKVIETNKKAVVTEKFIHINGYVPSAYYITKTLIVSDDPEEEKTQNVLTFYYNVDTKNMPYHIKYMVEDENGNVTKNIDDVEVKFKEKNYIDGYGERNTSKSFAVNTYAGYTVNSYQEIIFDTDDDPTEGTLTTLSASDASITINMENVTVANSKVVYIYYLKKQYPVKVIYQITSTDSDKIKEFNETIDKTGLTGEGSIDIGGVTYYTSFYKVVPDQKFNTAYSETAQNVEGFTVSGGDVRTRVISDDDAEMTNNRIVFNYTALDEVMFYYYAVIPDGSSYKLGDPLNPKLLNFNEETVDIGTRPKNTIEAVLNNGIYKFYGWYTDEECTVPVVKTVGTEIIISGTEDNQIRPTAANKDMTYYAKYDYRRGDLIISVTGDDVTIGGQSYEFIVKGKDSHNNWIELTVCIKPDAQQTITIKDLPIGDYTVTQKNWSWRYKTPEQQTITVNEGETVTAAFREVIENKKWLDGNAYTKNTFT